MNEQDGVLTMRRPPEERLIRYDNLDGNNTAYSSFQMAEAATVLGGAASVAHLSLYFPKNFADGALRAANITGTFALLGAVFGVTTNVTASMRGKDDPLNYFVGGCSAGVMLGARTKSYAVGTGSCLAFGGWGAFYKQWTIEGWGKFIRPPTY
ncbi:NADH dehydrogenase [ubiquinone] 1 alpha subcomplex subunit 11-like [Apostichopus japonicus]|uniref:NADH dehydrogenase [ubiquinone] 1 alpha subcomplex subunit 11-like n=1 Tax=Stichopus japonicus TaxID=307972 RepID=UPI003AB3860D